METKTLQIAENKVLEYDEKSWKDTLQLLEKLKKSDISIDIKRALEEPKYLEVLNNLHLQKGKTYWLEINVEDSYLSTMVMAWMFSKSDFDGGNGLRFMGCSLQSLMYDKPSGYSDFEREAIKSLYDSAFGKEANK